MSAAQVKTSGDTQLLEALRMLDGATSDLSRRNFRAKTHTFGNVGSVGHLDLPQANRHTT
jgi:hypothetical protein